MTHLEKNTDNSPDTVCWGVIPAGGSGERFKDSVAQARLRHKNELDEDKLMCLLPHHTQKQCDDDAHKQWSVLAQSVWALLTYVPCQRVMIAVHPNHLERYQAQLKLDLSQDEYAKIDWTDGGRTRRESVYRALQAIHQIENESLKTTQTTSPLSCSSSKMVWVHDGARPWLGASLVTRLRDAMGERREEHVSSEGSKVSGVLPALPMTDTVKMIDAEGMVSCTLERAKCVTVQTPQVFWWDALWLAYQQVPHELEATDDAQLVELWLDAQQPDVDVLHRVQTVDGDVENRKVTTIADLISDSVGSV